MTMTTMTIMVIDNYDAGVAFLSESQIEVNPGSLQYKV